MHAWLCGGGGGGVCSVQHRGGMQTMCVCVCARLAAGSLAITLYEVWQGEGKTSALGSVQKHTQTHLCARMHTHSHTVH